MNSKQHPYTYRNCDPIMITNLLLQGIAELELYAQARGYRQSGEMPTALELQPGVEAATQTLRKRLIKSATQQHKKTSLRAANQFLHLLCVRLLSYVPDAQVARLDISEKEAAIRSARAAWLKLRTEAEHLRLAYLAEKGDFYRRSL